MPPLENFSSSDTKASKASKRFQGTRDFFRDMSDRNKERNELDRSIKVHDKSMLKVEDKHRKGANELDEKITRNFTEGVKRKYSDGEFNDDELVMQIGDRRDV